MNPCRLEEKVKAVETELTWVEECIHTNLPRSHEPTDLLHISPSHNILEDDVIGEVHSPLCWCDRYYRCGTFLSLCALCGTVPRAFAVWGDVCRRSLVGGCVVWWGVMCRAVLCRGVLCRGGICGCVVRRCVMCRGVIGRCLVCWCVLWTACVRWHWHMVVVLHPCSGCLPPPLPSAQEEGSEKSKRTHQSSEEQYPFCSTSSPPLLARLLSFYFPAGVSPAVTVE